MSDDIKRNDDTSPNDDIVIFETAKIANITLNAPKRLNALSEDMCVPIGNKLNIWKKDPKVKAVLIKGAGDKAFCAGGDIVNVATMAKTNPEASLKFFRAEYGTNWRIKNFPKPYIALLDGITMGGGVGVSVHGHYRIATERTMFAMPETLIGFFPDVGGTYFLSRLRGNIGMFLGLTGHRLYADDLLNLGIATHYIHSSQLETLEMALSNIEFGEDGFEEVEDILHQYCTKAQKNGSLKPIEPQIHTLFEAEKLENIFENLENASKQNNSTGEFAVKTLKILNKMSPTSLKVTFEQIKRGKHLDFNQCMKLEFRLASRMMYGHDFFEGVRALLIDKDKSPKWQPNNISDISRDMVNAYFALLDKELSFNWDRPVEDGG